MLCNVCVIEFSLKNAKKLAFYIKFKHSALISKFFFHWWLPNSHFLIWALLCFSKLSRAFVILKDFFNHIVKIWWWNASFSHLSKNFVCRILIWHPTNFSSVNIISIKLDSMSNKWQSKQILSIIWWKSSLSTHPIFSHRKRIYVTRT